MRVRILFCMIAALLLCLLLSACGTDTAAPQQQSGAAETQQHTAAEEPERNTAAEAPEQSTVPTAQTETVKPSMQPKTEADMISDLTLGDFSLRMGNEPCVIRSLSVIKRQTLPEQYTDTVYVTVQADSTVISYIRSYVLEYNLYNDGWILDNVSEYADGPRDAAPLAGPEEENAVWYCEGYGSRCVGGYDSINVEDCDVDLESRTAVFHVACGYLCNNAYVTDYHSVSFYFDEKWIEDTKNCYLIDADYDWYYLCGSEWEYDGGLGIGYEYIYIYDIDPFNGTITLYAGAGGETWEDIYTYEIIDGASSGKRDGYIELRFYMDGDPVVIDAYTLYWGPFRMDRIED